MHMISANESSLKKNRKRGKEGQCSEDTESNVPVSRVYNEQSPNIVNFNEVKPNALGMSFRVERDMQFQFFFYVCDGYIVPEVPEAQV